VHASPRRWEAEGERVKLGSKGEHEGMKGRHERTEEARKNVPLVLEVNSASENPVSQKDLESNNKTQYIRVTLCSPISH
jgi:hypothetical protein